MTATARVRLKLLGALSLRMDGALVETLPKKSFIIAARLLTSPGEPSATRDEIAAFLWPDAADEQRRASLRTLIKRIRVALKGVEPSPFLIDEQTIALDVDAVAIDLKSFRQHVARASLADIVEASRLYDGPLLEGLDAGGETYQMWLAASRGRIGHGFARAASRVLQGDALMGQPRLRESIELKILAARPIDVAAHQALIKLQGQRVAMRPARRVAPFVLAGWPPAPFGPDAPSED